MRFSQCLLGFIALFCISSAKLADMDKDNRNVLDENIDEERYLTDTGEYTDIDSLEKVIDARILQLDRDDIADIREDVQYCIEMLHIGNLFSEGSTKMKDVCPKILKFFKCMDDVPNDFIGCDIAFLAGLFSDTDLGNNIKLFMSAKTMFQDMCSKDSAVLRDDIPENKDLTQCMEMVDIKDLLNGKFKTMDDVCPNILGFYNCLEELMKDTFGYDVAILAKVSSGTSDLGKYSRYFMKFKAIAQSLCPMHSALFGGAIAENEGVTQCLEKLDIERLINENNTKLEVLCPNIHFFTNCIEESIKDEFGYDLASLEKMLSGTSAGNSITFLIKLNDIVKDFCSKDSAIYRDFKMDEECFESIYSKHTSCNKNAKVAYETFNKIVNYKDKKDKECIKNGYILACSGAKIHEECGQRAFNTFIELLRRSSILQLKFCSENAFTDLKTSFLESLNLDADRQELFRKVFI